jgi:hypothetical protein
LFAFQKQSISIQFLIQQGWMWLVFQLDIYYLCYFVLGKSSSSGLVYSWYSWPLAAVSRVGKTFPMFPETMTCPLARKLSRFNTIKGVNKYNFKEHSNPLATKSRLDWLRLSSRELPWSGLQKIVVANAYFVVTFILQLKLKLKKEKIKK